MIGFIILVYGLITWGASLNCAAWTRLLVRKVRSGFDRPWHRDNIALVRLGLVFLSLGVAGGAGARLLFAVLEPEVTVIPSMASVPFLIVMVTAEPLFLRVDENHAQAAGKYSLAWRLYWAGALGGVLMFLVGTCTGAWSS